MQPAALQRIALDVAAARSVEAVLTQIVDGVAAESGTALARLWLIEPGDVCTDCILRRECPDQSRCLHLVASAGRSIVDPARCWECLDGRYRRFPLGVRKVGRIGGSGRAELLSVGPDCDWIVDPDWARDERIQCFAGQPLIYRGEVLGVLAVFSREALDLDAFGWLRTFADHAAVAIANARAFDEVQRLREQLELERDYLREELVVAQSFGGIIGESPAIHQTLAQVDRVAPSEVSVLIVGESGTGKELIASAIHERSERADRPMVRVNCASVPRELFESEFFGHVRGAFTGATGDRKGRFQVADGGTLFLDEVGEIPLELQGKLLRVLQEGQFSPVGSDRTLHVDVRVLAATNRDLGAAVAAGEFREDLYYRLGVFPIAVPPLRERMTDVPLLAAHFLRQIASRRNAPGLVLRKKDVAALLDYDWPGNVRELQNVIERAVILASAGRLQIDMLGGVRRKGKSGSGGDEVRGAAGPRSSGTGPRATEAGAFQTESERIERMRSDIRTALLAAGGKVSGPRGAAALLGIKPTTLASRMRALGIDARAG